MKKIKLRAGLWIAATALYVWLAAILAMLEIYLPACMTLVVGLLCGKECVKCGVDLERWRRVKLKVEEQYKDAALKGAWQQCCQKCGYEGFRVIAGRLVCNCCGEVLQGEQE